MNEALRNRTDISVVLVIFFGLAIAGILAGGFFVRDYARARASNAWIEIDAIVLSELDGSEGLRYAYSIDGHSYSSRRERIFTAALLAAKTKGFAAGDRVRVYINPKNHAYAVLYPGGSNAAYVLFFILSGLCVFFGGGGIAWALSQGVIYEVQAQTDQAFSAHQ